MIKDCINHINICIDNTEKKISKMSEEELSKKNVFSKWSRKEILGHLVDWAAISHSRFIRAQIDQPPFELRKYEQNKWVDIQHYNNLPTEDIFKLWKAYNKHLIHVISIIPKEKLSTSINIVIDRPMMIKAKISSKAFTLNWLINDYVYHLESHLESF